jgi:hypothetical protein
MNRHTLVVLSLLAVLMGGASAVYAAGAPTRSATQPTSIAQRPANAAPAAVQRAAKRPAKKKHKPAKDCFTSLASCGYPSRAAHDVGVSRCSKLPAFKRSRLPKGTSLDGSRVLVIRRAHTTLKNLDLPSNLAIEVNADDATINHICMMTNGDGDSGSTALRITPGTTGTKVENSTLGGANKTNHASDQAITNDGDAARTSATNDLLINCGECVHGAWKLDNSYVDVTATIPGEHYEDWYFSDATISANHDVFINPREQTAEIFGDTHGGNGGAADNRITVTNSLLAGGGYMIYTDSNSSSVGSSRMHITGNRFARCDGRRVYDRLTGGESCSGGVDAFGIFPLGGYFGVVYPNGVYCRAANQTWKNNTWDNNRAKVGC